MKHWHLFQVMAVFTGLLALPVHGTDTFNAQAAMREVTLTGFTRPYTRVTLAAEVSGRCERVNADIGDVIGADGVFACLDDTFIRLDIQANRVEQQRLNTELAYFGKEIRRLQKLIKTSTVAQAELDRMLWNRDNSRYQLQASKVAAKQLAEQAARYCIEAPPGLQVIERRVEPGEWVNAGQPLAVVGDFSTLAVPLALDQAEYTALQGLETLTLRLPATDTHVAARIIRVSPDFVPETRKIHLELALSEGVADKRGGLRAELRLRMPHPGGALEVPAQAVQARYEEFILTRPDGSLAPVVVLGPGNTADSLQVISPGLEAGMVFLSRPEMAAEEN